MHHRQPQTTLKKLMQVWMNLLQFNNLSWFCETKQKSMFPMHQAETKANSASFFGPSRSLISL